MNREQLIARNHSRVKAYLAKRDIDGVILAQRPNFSWFTGGGLSYVNAASETGVAGLYIDADKCLCVTNNIEAPRLKKEELKGTGIDICEVHWYDGAKAKQMWENLIGKKNVAADINVTGLPLQNIGDDFAVLRAELSEFEIRRYKEVGVIGGSCLGYVARHVKAGMSEFEIAGMISEYCFRRQARPWVILVAADERIKQFRHPIPTDKKLEKTVMLVVCVEKYGLIISCTRFVTFGSLTSDLQNRHQATVNIDTAFISSTVVGRKLADIFAIGLKAYEENGYNNEWQLHHQGGPTGYAARDFCVQHNSPGQVCPNQAFAWNPSITGTKSEDTIIATPSGPEVISITEDWPMINGQWQDRTLSRPAILTR